MRTAYPVRLPAWARSVLLFGVALIVALPVLVASTDRVEAAPSATDYKAFFAGYEVSGDSATLWKKAKVKVSASQSDVTSMVGSRDGVAWGSGNNFGSFVFKSSGELRGSTPDFTKNYFASDAEYAVARFAGLQAQEKIQKLWQQDLTILREMSSQLQQIEEKKIEKGTHFTVGTDGKVSLVSGTKNILDVNDAAVSLAAHRLYHLMVVGFTCKGDCATTYAAFRSDYRQFDGQTGDQIKKPLNLFVDRDGNYAGQVDVQFGAEYQGLEDFLIDYTTLRSVDLAKLEAGMALADARKMVDGALTKINNSTTDTAGDINECGNFRARDIVLPNIRKAICGLVLTVRDLAKWFLGAATDLLFRAANITGGSGGFLGWLIPGNPGASLEQEIVSSAVVVEAYRQILNLVNILLILAFLVIALANILQIQINTYAIKKLLPGLIIGFIVAHWGMFFMRTSLEVTSQVSGAFTQIQKVKNEGMVTRTQFVNTFSSVGPESANGESAFLDKGGEVIIVVVLQQAVLNLFILAAAVLIFILGFLFIVRSWIFFFLVPLSPLALFALFFPPMKKVWDQWWRLTTGWLFMPIVAMFWIWLGFMWMTSGNAAGWSDNFIMGYVFGIIAIYMAIKTPFSMAGELKMVVDRWNKFGKSAWKSTGGFAVNTGVSGATLEGIKLANATRIGPAYRGAKNALKAMGDNVKSEKELFMNGPADQSEESGRKKAAHEAELRAIRDSYSAQVDAVKADKALSEDERSKRVEQLTNDQNAKLAKEFSRYNTEKSFFERIDTFADKRKELTKTKKDRIEGQKSFTEAQAKEELLAKNERYAETKARVDHLKEVTGQLEDVMKDEIKKRKNANEDFQQLYIDYKKKKIVSASKAEAAETDRELTYLESLDTKLVDMAMETSVQGEVREKRKAKVENERAMFRQKIYDFQTGIQDAVADGKLDVAEEYAKQLEQLDSGLTGAVELVRSGKSSSEIKTELGNLVNKRFPVDPTILGDLKRRIRSKSNGALNEDAKFYLETGIFSDNLFSAREVTTIVDGIGKGVQMDPHEIVGKLIGDNVGAVDIDAEKAWAGMITGLRRGELDSKYTDRLADTLQRVKEDTSNTSTWAVNARTRLNEADPNNELIKTLKEISNAGTQRDKQRLFNEMDRKINMEALQFDRRVAATPNALYMYRKDRYGTFVPREQPPKGGSSKGGKQAPNQDTTTADEATVDED